MSLQASKKLSAIFRTAALGVALALITTGCINSRSDGAAKDSGAGKDPVVQSVTEENFENEVLKSDKLVLIDFYADWCGPCRELSPRLEQVADENAGKVKVVRINVDENSELAASFKARSIPLLVFMRDGQSLYRSVGNISNNEIEELIAKSLQEPPAGKAEGLKSPQIGSTMPDGTIYAGISPDTKQPMYAAPADAPTAMNFNAAAQYAKNLEVGCKKGFRLPSLNELNVLFQNRDKGALKGTFNSTSSKPELHWSSTSDNIYTACDSVYVAWGKRFSDNGKRYGDDGNLYNLFKDNDLSVRCVR